MTTYSNIYKRFDSQTKGSFLKFFKIAKKASTEIFEKKETEQRTAFVDAIDRFLSGETETYLNVHSFDERISIEKNITFVRTIKMLCNYLDYNAGELSKEEFQTKILAKLQDKVDEAKSELEVCRVGLEDAKKTDVKAFIAMKTAQFKELEAAVEVAIENFNSKVEYFNACKDEKSFKEYKATFSKESEVKK